MRNPMKFIDGVIHVASLKLIEVNIIVNDLTPDDAEWDAFIQVQKDLRTFIQEQEHTQSLITDGSI
jgi:hypothetical protein